jgi:phosphatidylglycerol:prolipoprotein diacylglycerol transferase
LIRYGAGILNLFALLVGLGASAGLASVLWRSGDSQRGPRLVQAGLVVLLGAFLGGRVGFVLADWAYFQFHLLEIPQTWLGGISGVGALAGGLLAYYPASLTAKRPFYFTIDRLYPMLAPLAVSAWLAAWAAGTAYGPIVEKAWWALPARDEWGAIALRWPLQLAGAILTILLFGLIDSYSRRLKHPGQLGSLGLLALILPFFGLSYMRADPVSTLGGAYMASLARAALLGVTILIALPPFLLPVRKRSRLHETPPSTLRPLHPRENR